MGFNLAFEQRLQTDGIKRYASETSLASSPVSSAAAKLCKLILIAQHLYKNNPENEYSGQSVFPPPRPSK